MEKNDQINKFVDFSKEIIQTQGINEVQGILHPSLGK